MCRSEIVRKTIHADCEIFVGVFNQPAAAFALRQSSQRLIVARFASCDLGVHPLNKNNDPCFLFSHSVNGDNLTTGRLSSPFFFTKNKMLTRKTVSPISLVEHGELREMNLPARKLGSAVPRGCGAGNAHHSTHAATLLASPPAGDKPAQRANSFTGKLR